MKCGLSFPLGDMFDFYEHKVRSKSLRHNLVLMSMPRLETSRANMPRSIFIHDDV